MIQRVLAAHVRWYAQHKALAWAVSSAAAVGLFLVWWALFGAVAAVVIEAIVVALTLVQWMTTRRRVARR
jgi:hypothetical protein